MVVCYPFFSYMHWKDTPHITEYFKSKFGCYIDAVGAAKCHWLQSRELVYMWGTRHCMEELTLQALSAMIFILGLHRIYSRFVIFVSILAMQAENGLYQKCRLSKHCQSIHSSTTFFDIKSKKQSDRGIYFLYSIVSYTPLLQSYLVNISTQPILFWSKRHPK